jgi:hypothetical protein
MKQFVLIGVMLFSLFKSYGQETDQCSMLRSFLSNPKAIEVFYLDKYKELPIVLIDAMGFFSECDIRIEKWRKIEITTDTSSKESINYSNLIVYVTKLTPKRYKMGVFFKVRNALFYFEYRKRKGKFVFTSAKGGYF